MESLPHASLTDHDLLIRVDTRLGGLETEMRLLRDGTHSDIKDLKENKLDKTEFSTYKQDIEKYHAEKIKDVEGKFAEMEKKFEEKLDEVEGKVETQGQKLDRLMSVYLIGSGFLLAVQLIAPFVLHHYGFI